MIRSGVQRDGHGFRLRGLEMTRIETFTDAAFAFALTLLVISMDPPSSLAELRTAMMQVPAFVLSASLLMLFWWGHHEWSRRYGLDDFRAFLASCFLVFTVLVYVYPLRFMFGTLVEFFSVVAGIRTFEDLAFGVVDVPGVFVIYGIGFTTMALAITLLYVHAWGKRVPLELDAVERYGTLTAIGAWSILVAVGMLSTTFALLRPGNPGLPGWTYALLGVVMPVYSIVMARRGPRSAAAADDNAAAVRDTAGTTSPR